MTNTKPKFKEFKIGASYFLRGKKIFVSDDGIFDIVPTKKKINANLVSMDGDYPYVARGESNNGIKGYINFDKKYLNPANTISFGQDTATMYFQPDEYFTGDKIQIFNLNKKYGVLSEKIALYIIASLKKVFVNYAWGQQSFAVDSISNMNVKLPVAASGYPDFVYMEKYIAELEQQRLAELEQQRLAELDTYLKVTGLDDYELTDEDKETLSLSLKNQHLTKISLWKMIAEFGGKMS